jgi:hypothetical protein
VVTGLLVVSGIYWFAPVTHERTTNNERTIVGIFLISRTPNL